VTGVGFSREPRRLRITFEDGHELHGLEVVTRSVPIGTILAVLRAAGGSSQPGVEQIEAMATLFEQLGAALIEWNYLDHETQEPVPPTPDGLSGLDFEFVTMLAMHWVDAVVGAAAPLANGSSGGRPQAAFPVASLPMVPRSASRAS
jgi:hypothetical protein